MKMKIKLSKLTALILTLVMFVSLIPLNVFAEDYQTGYEPDDPEVTQQLLAISENPDKDLNNDGRVSILDARQILRVIVKLDTFKVKAEFKVGEVYETGAAFDMGPRKWTCTVSPEDGLTVTKTITNPATSYLPDIYKLGFTATVPGEYEAVLKYENSTTHEVLREITYNFTVTE